MINIKSYLFSIIIILLGISELNAQINPPEFLCIRNDSLFWEPPVNDCGPFESITIFFSTNEDGPYTVLDNTVFFTATEYEHPNPGGNLFYYYLVANYDCPGEEQLTSDTLNTRPPEIGPIVRASVEGGGVLIEWEESPSSQVNAYIIYRIEDNGTFPIDTVFNTTQYIDTNGDENTQSETYFVVAVDRCDNTSIFGMSHSTVLLDYTLSDCDREIVLNWEPYNSWTAGVGTQEVWIGVNGASPQFLATIDANANTYTIDQVVNGFDYEIFILATEQSNAMIASRSSAVTFNASIIEPITELSILSVRTNLNNEVELNWNWNPGAALTQYDIVQTDESGNANFFIQSPVVLPLPTSEIYLDTEINASEEVFTYQIQTVDGCDDLATSNSVKNIALSCGQADNITNEINWSPFEMERATLNSYKLFRIIENSEELIAEITDGSTNYFDELDATVIGNVVACYYVVAEASLELLDGNLTDAFVQSNRCCIEKAAFIVAPNAFAPFGKNNIFKPLVFNQSSLQRYELNIWSRWGELIFQSNDPELGWNGRKDGRDMPQGVYAFSVNLTMNNGDEVQENGSVLLLK